MFGVNRIETNRINIYSECIPYFPVDNLRARLYAVGFRKGSKDGYHAGYQLGWYHIYIYIIPCYTYSNFQFL